MTPTRKKLLLFVLPILMIGAGLFFAHHALAQPDLGLSQVEDDIGLPTTDIRTIVANIIRVALGLLGIVALVLVLYGGFVWMTAGGNEDKIAQAKKILVNAVIGLVIIFSAYAIVSFVMNRLLEATSDYPSHCFNGEQDSGEEGVDCGGDCAPCGAGVIPGFGNVFYVNSKPSGEVCVRNFYAIVVFNREVNLSSVPGNLAILRASDGAAAQGSWDFLSSSAQNALKFTPSGDCGDGTNDCLDANTEYNLVFVAPDNILSQDGLTLDCVYGEGCDSTSFITGEGIDREPPVVVISYPNDGERLEQGTEVPVDVVFTDDNGVQNISLYADGRFVDSQGITGCQSSGSVQIPWPTAGVSLGNHTLRSVGWDYSAAEDDDTVTVSVQPTHCFNGVMDEDETGVDCGGVCGACSGSGCASNEDCASGYCEIPSGETSGVCVDRAQITNVSPLSGAFDTYVTISGKFFGDNGGQVFFTDALGGWIEAPVVSCGSGFDNWTAAQIVVSVPEGAGDGPVRVDTAAWTDSLGIEHQFSDTTNDDWGPNFIFDVNDLIRPGLCSLYPANGPPYTTTVQVNGQNFGATQDNPAEDSVYFGALKSIVTTWTDNLVRVKVPGLGVGPVSVNLENNGVSGNGLRFYVSDEINPDTPVIHGISPNHGARGEYVTITGDNFGNTLGKVILKPRDGGVGLGTEGNFDFPEECGDAVWRNDQIIFKIPDAVDLNTEYSVQVQTPVNPPVLSPIGAYFLTESGDPSPGLCRIEPISGPIPFPVGQNMSFYGEYFTNDNVSVPYFWSDTAQPDSIGGRVQATEFLSWWDRELVVAPPVGAISGPVVVSRSTDGKMSNPLAFSVFDCVANDNTCTQDGYKCCSLGEDAGVCRPEGELCSGETRSSGYMWRFSTRDFPMLPRVLENCDANTDLGKNLPSPSPNVKWNAGNNDHTNVCRKALVTVGFTTPIDQATINAGTVKVYACAVDSDGEGGVVDNRCRLNGSTEVNLAADSYVLENFSDANNNYFYLSIYPVAGTWTDNTWYQVVLSDNIQSVDTGEGSFNLQADRPCGNGSAYCFVFRTDAQDCRMNRVVITPFSYWTSVLEEPMRFRVLRNNASDPGSDLYYVANGLSDQHCIWMNTNNYDWTWSSDNSEYAGIFSIDGDNPNRAQVSALANTVGVGLTDDAVAIRANATFLGDVHTGVSPLTIDLSSPEVADYWPNCLTACPNAEVGVRFNLPMSDYNLSRGVRLYACVDSQGNPDENCYNRQAVNFQPAINPADHREIVFNLAAAELNPGEIYLAVLSAPSTTPSSQLWSEGSLSEQSVLGKVYDKEFSWRFKVKNERCLLDRVVVRPEIFYAPHINSRAVYSAFAYSSPDECRVTGQRLNVWDMDWVWTSSNPQVARVQTFTTRGYNNFCTSNCLLKGSDVLYGEEFNEPVCGNNRLEAGEDCDNPDPNSNCGLNCLFINKENTGSSPSTGAEDINASICGNGTVGEGEDCDLGIAPDVTNPQSAMSCAINCLHSGSNISASWCALNSNDFGGFDYIDYAAACDKAISRCGDNVYSPNESPGCELGGLASGACDTNCVLFEECEPYDANGRVEGCGLDGRWQGSSLDYSQPSICGDGIVGIGENLLCEQNLILNHTLTDPWALAIGVGLGSLSGEPPAQRATINTVGSQSNGPTAGDSGEFVIQCGYKYDSECPQTAVCGEAGCGVADNTCCYARANVVSTYPASTTPIIDEVCPNTYIEVVFDKKIDPLSLSGNVLLAERNTDQCVEGEDVTHYFGTAKDYGNLPWYKKMWYSVVDIAYKIRDVILPGSVRAQGRGSGVSTERVWCAGITPLSTEVVYEPLAEGQDEINTVSHVLIKLQEPLDFRKFYGVVLRPGVRDARGVSIGSDVKWRFRTGSEMCLLDSLTIDPDEHTFKRAEERISLLAQATETNGQLIQPVAGYIWEYSWGPWQNDYVLLDGVATSSAITATAKNRNGEIDVTAQVKFLENVFTNDDPEVSGKTHLTVFLCENQWLGERLKFKDTSYDFSTYYCADSGVFGTADDLPFLDYSVKQAGESGVEENVLRKYLFFTGDVPDAIGISIIPNPEKQSVRKLLSLPAFQSYQTLDVDGNDAITDGNNIYIDTVIRGGDGNIYSNIYLFSLNQNAGPEMRNIFEQMIDNLEFNLDSVNIKYCGTSLVDPYSPNYDRPCETDLDCAFTDTPLCLNARDKIRRNYRRFKDLRDIQTSLEDYLAEVNNSSYPIMDENTYLSGQALSVWPGAWNELGSRVGVLPQDPINKLKPSGTCYQAVNRACVQDSDCGSLPTDQLTSRWLADGNTHDELGVSDGVIVGGVNYTPGKGHGDSFEFTGEAESYVNIPHQDVYNGNSFSVSLWFKPTRQITGMLVKKGGLGDNNESLGGFEIEYSGRSFAGGADNFNNGTIRFAIYNVAGTPSYYAVDSNSPLELNKWHHIVATYNGSNAMVLYIDTVAYNQERNQDRSVATPSSFSSSPEDFKIGQSFNGAIDNILFYESILSATQVGNLRNYLCVLHDATTGWSTEDFRFSFACNTESMAYRYVYSSVDRNYTLRANLERDGLLKGSSFVRVSNKVVYDDFGACVSGDEISSPNSLVCGDGLVGQGETCDPPGAVSYDTSACPTRATKLTCQNNCQWNAGATVDCRGVAGGYCGDGKIQFAAGEVCDDGELNGQIWRCRSDCSGIDNETCGNGRIDRAAGEICDPTVDKAGKDGWCVSGPYIYDPDNPDTSQPCNSNSECATGICYITNVKYSQAREESCNWDCKSRGPYCGDGNLQGEWNEECEGSESCLLSDGREGIRSCVSCKKSNGNALDMASLWEFDYIGSENNEVLDSVGDKNGRCRPGECPEIVEGNTPSNPAFDFGTNATSPKLVYLFDQNNNDLATPNFTWESWFYPRSGNIFAARMWEKGGNLSREGGIGMEFNRPPNYPAGCTTQEWAYGSGCDDMSAFTNNVRCLTWMPNAAGVSQYYPVDSYGVSLNDWHHLACTFSATSEITGGYKGMLKIYLDGRLESTRDDALLSSTNYPLCFGSKCNSTGGLSSTDSRSFKGTIEDVAFYSRELTESIIYDHYSSEGWYCSPLDDEEYGTDPEAEDYTPYCGNGILDENEVCDLGDNNGVPCTPSRGTRCSYCSYGCDRILSIERN